MKRSLFTNFGLVFSLCLSVLFSGCCISIGDVFKAKYKKTEHASVPITDTTELEIETDVGSITVTGAEVSDCNITAEITVKARTKEKARELAEEVKIEVKPSGDKLSIKVKKPAALKSRSLVVDFKVTAPKQLNLNCSTHVGTVKTSDLKGQIKASANVGSIICNQVVTDLDLKANVGSIKVRYSDAAAAACNADIATNVGSIEFAGPPGLSAQLDASTNVGSIKTDKPVTVVGKVGKSIKGTIGSGQGTVRLRTNVGSIEIK
ncbi:MAG: DUF4097 family beta strand repeat-containing protein [Phycisphaerae bacterium]